MSKWTLPSPRRVRPAPKVRTLSLVPLLNAIFNHFLPTERKVGDTYSPDCLPDHRGPYFAHQDSKLVQRDYKDLDGDLIAPHELYENLTEGTLFSAQNTMHIYIPRESGAPTQQGK
jgi:hypothetical protein